MTRKFDQTMECCACGQTWLDAPGAWGQQFAAGCPRCGSVYWVWKTFREFIGGKS